VKTGAWIAIGAALLVSASTPAQPSSAATQDTSPEITVAPLEACVQPAYYLGGPLETCSWAPPRHRVIPVAPER
jgi:hypothetical protein